MSAAKDLLASVEAMYGVDSLAAMSVQAAFTINRRGKRPRRPVETGDFVALVGRMIRRAGERVGDADEPELAALLGLELVLAQALQTAVDGQRSVGRSWAYIATATKATKSAAFQRWGGKE